MPSYFRFLTLTGYRLFQAAKVDVVVLETGMGGSLDATNVFEKPVVCGITLIDYDHMDVLGHTLTEIAGEKAGILKVSCLVLDLFLSCSCVYTTPLS